MNYCYKHDWRLLDNIPIRVGITLNKPAVLLRCLTFFSRCRPAPSSADFNCLTLYCLLGSCLSFHVFTRCVLVVLRYAGVSPRFDVAVCFLQLMELWLLCTCFAPLGFSMPLSRRRGRGGKGLVNCPGIVAPEWVSPLTYLFLIRLSDTQSWRLITQRTLLR